MKLKVTIGLFLATFLLSAQTARMNRDIEVAEKILESLLEETNGNTISKNDRFFMIGGNAEVEGTYLEGFGAMFSITSSNLFNPLILTEKDSDESGNSSTKITIRSNKKRYHFDSKDFDEHKVKIKQTFKSVVETFFSDYAYLMRQIGDDEKIMVRYGGVSSRFDSSFPVLVLNGKNKRNYSATITKKAINAFQQNDNKQQLVDKIDYVFEEAKERATKEKDLELLSTILKKLHNDKEEGALRISGTPYYEKIEGIGAIYSVRVRAGGGLNYFDWGLNNSSKTFWHDGRLAIIDNEGKEASRQEVGSEDLDKNYETFLTSLKENIIDYGSIVKSLSNGEALTFKLHFPKCNDCKVMPKKLEITAKKSTLEGYRKEQISLEKAVSQLAVK